MLTDITKGALFMGTQRSGGRVWKEREERKEEGGGGGREREEREKREEREERGGKRTVGEMESLL